MAQLALQVRRRRRSLASALCRHPSCPSSQRKSWNLKLVTRELNRIFFFKVHRNAPPDLLIQAFAARLNIKSSSGIELVMLQRGAEDFMATKLHLHQCQADYCLDSKVDLFLTVGVSTEVPHDAGFQ